MPEDRAILEDRAQKAADSVGNEIDLSFLPKELVSICNGVVQAHHERNGYRDLMKDLSEKETMVCILVHRELRDLMGSIIAGRKLSIFCWIASGMLLLIAAAWHGWVAVGVIPVMVGAYYVGKNYRGSGMLIAAFLLALEMVSEDFIGLATYLPSVWKAAHDKIENFFPNQKTRFMDIYIPGRNELDQKKFQKMIRDRIIS